LSELFLWVWLGMASGNAEVSKCADVALEWF